MIIPAEREGVHLFSVLPLSLQCLLLWACLQAHLSLERATSFWSSNCKELSQRVKVFFPSQTGILYSKSVFVLLVISCTYPCDFCRSLNLLWGTSFRPFTITLFQESFSTDTFLVPLTLSTSKKSIQIF